MGCGSWVGDCAGVFGTGGVFGRGCWGGAFGVSEGAGAGVHVGEGHFEDFGRHGAVVWGWMIFFFAMGGLWLLGEVARWSYTMGVFMTRIML